MSLITFSVELTDLFCGEASRWITRVCEGWEDAPAFTVESEAPPIDPPWFNSQD